MLLGALAAFALAAQGTPVTRDAPWRLAGISKDQRTLRVVRFLPLDVDLGAPLAGRYVTGGPDFRADSRPEVMPRVLGLRRADALRALRRQRIPAAAFGRKGGVVHTQSPRPGRPLPECKVSLITGPFAARARLAVNVPDGQTVASVLRRGLRYRYTVNPDVEVAVDALTDCNGHDGGEDGFPVRRARGLVVDAAQVLREDFLVRRTATVTLRRR